MNETYARGRKKNAKKEGKKLQSSKAETAASAPGCLDIHQNRVKSCASNLIHSFQRKLPGFSPSLRESTRARGNLRQNVAVREEEGRRGGKGRERGRMTWEEGGRRGRRGREKGRKRGRKRQVKGGRERDEDEGWHMEGDTVRKSKTDIQTDRQTDRIS